MPSDTTRVPVGRDATHRYTMTTLSTFWPKAEHEKLLARWPRLAAEFLRERKVRKPSSDDLLAYPDLRSQPRMTSWPPARTSPCWCGSGRKYKVCCRPHGHGTLD